MKITKIIIILIFIFIFPIKSVFASPITIDFESSGGYTVTTNETGTDTDWQRSTTDPYEGSFSLESNEDLNDNEDACFEITNNVTSGSEDLSFYYKVSSEANYDYLRFYIDGSEQDEWAGTIDWTQASYTLSTGNHTLRWCYEKDYSVSNGDDKAWVDLVKITMDINNISDQVFHFDAMDIDGDGDTSDNPSEGGSISTWVDIYNGYNATAGTAPTYLSESIKTYPGVVFNGSSTLNITNQTDINTSSYDEKSFAIIFKTGDDINTLQNIYEQGGGTRGYAIQIDGGNIYAGVWNRNERASGDQYKTLSASIEPNTEYRLIMIQNSTETLLEDRTFEVFLDGVSLGILYNVDVQQAHSGGIELGRSDGTRRLSTQGSLGAGSFFSGNIGEFFSWNYSLSTSEINTIDNYLYDKWLSREFPKTPGGVSNGLQIWLKADAGTSTTTNGNSLTTWNDQSGNGYNAGGGVSPTFLNNDNDNLNFNPVIDFNGTNQYLENLNNGAYTHSYFTVVVPDNQVDGTLGGQVPFAFDCDSGVLSSGTCGLTFAGTVLGAFTVAINDEVITHAIGSSTNWRSSEIGTSSYEASKPMLIHINENSSGDGTEIYEKGLLKNNYNTNTYQTISTSDYRIGMSSDSSYPFPYDGKIAEIINFSSRTSETNKQKIESYLSLKYGITLNNGTTDYIASDGTTTIWDESNAGLYIHDIFGIGRDDNSELSQIKSKSINNDNIITIEAIGEGNNINPSFVDIDDKEFFTISNNDGGNTWSAIDAPAGYFILDRKWIIQESGDVGNISLDINVSNTNFDIPDLSLGTNYYFIYDSNNNDSLADETPIAMTNTSGDIWNISGNVGDTIFTFVSEASTNNIPTDISLSNDNINENVNSGTIVGSLSTIDADIGDSHTYSFVSGTGDNDNSLFSINGSNLSINVSPDYEIKPYFYVRIQTDDGNGGQYQKAFTININNTGETITSLINFEQEIDSYKYSVTSGSWSRNTTNSNEGSYSFESSNSGNNTQSCFEVTHTFSGIGTINFDYEVSSQTNSDYLSFYIDNTEQDSWSGDISWSTYTDNSIEAGSHIYKWCYIKDNSGASGTDSSFIDYISFTNGSIDITSPTINSINYSSGTLLPGGNHNIIINYSDLESGINTSSDSITLNKWNGASWGSDISSTGLNLSSKAITATTATYPTNNLEYGKYSYNFQIIDNAGNPSSTGAIFYIDEPELIIGNGEIDIGSLTTNNDTFSSDLDITVKTIGAGFDLILNKGSDLDYNGIQIQDWNGINGFGYDQEPYTSNISIINNNEIIASQAGSINTSGEKNTYIYRIKLGINTQEEQAAGVYIGNINFSLDLDY